jgi:hypothetical protein
MSVSPFERGDHPGAPLVEHKEYVFESNDNQDLWRRSCDRREKAGRVLARGSNDVDGAA